jgi:hypothetical protein
MRPRGFAIIFALLLSAVLAMLIVAATVLLRPAVQTLDQHHEFAQAQLLADGALEEALAELQRGGSLKSGTRTVPGGEVVLEAVEAKGPAGENGRGVRVTVRVVSSSPLAADGPAEWVRVSLAARLREEPRWRLLEYAASEAAREVGSSKPRP